MQRPRKLLGMQRSATRRGRAGWRAAGLAALVIATACHAAPAGGTGGDPPRGGTTPATGAPPSGTKVTQAEIAAKDNADGERLLREGKHAEAAQKFFAASSRWPVVAYSINHCIARMRTGELEYALRICQSVRVNEPTPAQRSQAEQLIKDIIELGKTKGLELCDGCIYEAPPDPPPH